MRLCTTKYVTKISNNNKGIIDFQHLNYIYESHCGAKFPQHHHFP